MAHPTGVSSGLEADVRAAVTAVRDPEYPDLTIRELGIFEDLCVDEHGDAHVALVPTFLGCPALGAIEADVASAARAAGARSVEVTFLTSPSWTPERILPEARQRLRREYTVGIRGLDGQVVCPNCGSRDVDWRSDFGPTLCRGVAWCPSCRNAIEVVRR